MTAVVYSKDHHIVHLLLNRPDTRNALSDDLISGIVSGLEQANADRDVRCVILSGAGKGFSSGGNIKEIREMTASKKMPEEAIAQWYRDGIQQIPLTFAKIDVVTIAAVHGHAIGAGCDLAAMCDIRIAAENASFAESFVKVGIVPGDGGGWLLPRIIGMARTKQMIFTAEAIGARKALDWGLVSDVVADDALLDAAQDMATEIAALPPNALRAAKQLLHSVETDDLPTSLDKTATMQASLQIQPDHLEAIDAILEKRPPNFTGAIK